MTAPRWALGWYANKRHIIGPDIPHRDGSIAALCSPYTTVFPNGINKEPMRYRVSAADTEATMSKPACKHCERLAAKA